MISSQTHIDLLALINQDVEPHRVASTQGGEYASPCPFCGGHDRFRIWPEHPSGQGRYWCRQCGVHGDAIDYLQQRDGLTFRDARKRLGWSANQNHARSRLTSLPLAPPSARWQAQARSFVEQCRNALWAGNGRKAHTWLRARGLTEETICSAGLGFNSMENRQASKLWGLTRSSPIWLPPGIVVPWHIDGNVWRVNIRRLSGNPKYIGPAGSRNGLYGADGLRVRPDRPVALVEGEFDALSLQQEAGDLITAVATGSTTGARRPRWIALLAQAPVVLISFDLDEAGEKAARYWLDILPQARRWKPYWEDVNAMLRDGVSLRSWLAAGLDKDLG